MNGWETSLVIATVVLLAVLVVVAVFAGRPPCTTDRQNMMRPDTVTRHRCARADHNHTPAMSRRSKIGSPASSTRAPASSSQP